MKTSSMVGLVHPTGEDAAGLKLPTLGGQVTVERTDEALTPYGGLAAWSAFVQHLGTLDRLAASYPLQRTSPNAAPVREIIHSFSLTALVEGKRFSHVGWLTTIRASRRSWAWRRCAGRMPFRAWSRF